MICEKCKQEVKHPIEHYVPFYRYWKCVGRVEKKR